MGRNLPGVSTAGGAEQKLEARRLDARLTAQVSIPDLGCACSRKLVLNFSEWQLSGLHGKGILFLPGLPRC